MDYIAAIRRESDALHSAVAQALDAAVPACPGWKGRDLLSHIGEVQWFWREVLVQRPASGKDVERTPMPDGDDARLHWAADATDALIEALGRESPETPVWTWAPDHQSVAFVLRRQAHEALMHRYDAESAAGDPKPLDTALAADGAAEFLQIMLPCSDRPVRGNGEIVVLRATDHPASWTVRLTPSAALLDEGADPGATVVCRGTASDLDLAMWRRLPIDELEIQGDAEVARRFAAAVDLS